MNNQNEQLINKYFELFNEHKWEEMANLYTPSAEFKDPSLGPGPVSQTRQQIIDRYSELSRVFSDVRDEVIQIYPSGDTMLLLNLCLPAPLRMNHDLSLQFALSSR